MKPGQDKEEFSNLFTDFTKQVAGKTNNTIAVIQAIRRWAGDRLSLTQILCNLILEYSFPISQDQEETVVDRIVQDRIVRDWENNAAGEELQKVSQTILNDEKSISLLKLYSKILQKGEIAVNDSTDQQKLLDVGLVKKERGKLKTANAIYATIFNLEWVSQKSPNAPEPPSTPSSSPSSSPKDGDRAANPTRLLSGIAFFAILTIAVIYPLLPKPTPIPSPTPSTTKPIPNNSNASDLCTSNASNPEVQLNRLVALKEQAGQNFSQECQLKLDELLYDTGIEKAKNGEFNIGVERLCEISQTSSKFTIAKAQLNAWYSNTNFRRFIESYLKALKDEGRVCPAAKDIPIS